jgi:hypothetical protein
VGQSEREPITIATGAVSVVFEDDEDSGVSLIMLPAGEERSAGK